MEGHAETLAPVEDIDGVHRHDTMISAAVFPTPDLARRHDRQDWVSWSLDAVMPTIYHNFHETAVSWIETATRKGTTALDLDTPLFSGLFVPELSPEEPAHATERVRSGGAPGISLFTASEMTNPHWQPVTSVLQA